MSNKNLKSVKIDQDVHAFLKMKSARLAKSIKELIREAVYNYWGENE